MIMNRLQCPLGSDLTTPAKRSILIPGGTIVSQIETIPVIFLEDNLQFAK